MSLDYKIELYNNNAKRCLKHYVKIKDNKIILNDRIYFYMIDNKLLCYEKEQGDYKEITFLNNTNDDIIKFDNLMTSLNYKEYEII